jgi:hypothetical protein
LFEIPGLRRLGLVSMGEEVICTIYNSTYADNYRTYSMIVPLAENGEYQLTLTSTFGDVLTGNATI